MPKLIQHLLETGQCQTRHGYVAKPEEGVTDFVAVTVISRADAQCTVYRTRNRQEAYFFHYLPTFVEARLKVVFPGYVTQRATHYELFILESEDHDQQEEHF